MLVVIEAPTVAKKTAVQALLQNLRLDSPRIGSISVP